MRVVPSEWHIYNACSDADNIAKIYIKTATTTIEHEHTQQKYICDAHKRAISKYCMEMVAECIQFFHNSFPKIIYTAFRVDGPSHYPTIFSTMHFDVFICILLHDTVCECVSVLALMLLCVRFRMKVMLVECYRKYASNSFAAMFRHPWTLNHPTNQPTNRKKNSKQCAHGIFKSECSLSYLYMQIDR